MGVLRRLMLFTLFLLIVFATQKFTFYAYHILNKSLQRAFQCILRKKSAFPIGKSLKDTMTLGQAG